MPVHPFIPVVNGASCELIYALAGDVSENVFHVTKGSPFTLANLQALRTAVNNWDAATGSTQRSNQAFLTRIRTKALDTNSSPMEDFTLPSPRAGAQGGFVLPPNVAFCVKLSTGLAGRSFRGRWYWGNLTTNWQADAGHTSVANANALAGFLTTLIANLATAGFTMVVVSYMSGGVWRSTGLATPITTAVSVDTAFDSMRKRLPNRGHAI